MCNKKARDFSQAFRIKKVKQLRRLQHLNIVIIKTQNPVHYTQGFALATKYIS